MKESSSSQESSSNNEITMEVFRENREKLYDYLKTEVDLVEYIEQLTGETFKKSNERWKICCPLHSEKTPSFMVSHEDEGAWLFYCFGCQRKGSIIDFTMLYESLEHPEEAVIFLAERLGLFGNTSWMSRAISNTKRKSTQVQELELIHLRACNVGRGILRKHVGDQLIGRWVVERYKAMDSIIRAVSDDNIEQQKLAMDRIGEKMLAASVNTSIITGVHQ